MGEVYKARDTRLDRTVAIKVLPEHIAKREEARQRFEREARAVASLNHPHICVLHDIGNQDGTAFMVMEHLEGETLGARLQKGALPLEQAIALADQIADALDRAHRAGVTHRDIKPGNIMLTRDGVKVLDFGLAKSTHKPGPTEQTLTAALTTEGAVIGTPQYMAPEQFEGKEADARSDVWAFGAVLYEMVTGQKAFQGKNYTSLVGAILAAEPPPMSVTSISPAWLERLVKRCLAKDPDDRYQSIRDLLLDLRALPAQAQQEPAHSSSRHSSVWDSRAAWGVAALGVLAFAALAVVHFRETPPQQDLVRFQVTPPAKMKFDGWDAVSISPDGRKLVFAGNSADGQKSLWLRSMDSNEVTQLAGTENAFSPFWSPDSRSVAFFTQGDRKLKKVDAPGGPPVALCDVPGTNVSGGGSWSKSGVILSGGGKLYRVPAAGGDPNPVLEPDTSRNETSLVRPWFLPDGTHFLYLARNQEPGKDEIRAGSLDSRETKAIVQTTSNAMYSAPGYLLFNRQETLFAQAFDADSLQLAGDPAPVAERLQQFAFAPGANYSVSQNGTLAYRGAGNSALQLTWFNREGRKLEAVGAPGVYQQFVLSPDGKRLAVQRDDPKTNNWDLWLLELASGIFSRFTFDPGRDADPVWAPDSKSLAFASNRKGAMDIYKKEIGGGSEQVLLESKAAKYPEDWLADGSVIYIGAGISRLPPGPSAKPETLYKTEFPNDEPQVSPDGRWIAFASNESGQWEVYAAAFPSFGQKRQVSNGGGMGPRWRKDGREMFYLTQDGKLMAMDTKLGATLETGPPKLLFQTSVAVNYRFDQYAVSADGQKFLYGEPVESAARPIHVVLNWAAGLGK
jgi:serine/threonine protein kinase